MKIKTLLVPTELDELSEKVTGFAIKLATQLNISEIVLLNVIIPAHNQTFSASGDVFASEGRIADRFNVVLMRKHQGLVEKEAMKFSTENIRLFPIVRLNDSKTDMNVYMKEFNADMIVCGSRDEHSFFEKLFGSDGENIVRKVDYPAIILKNDTEASDINMIAVAIDVNEEEQNGLNDIVDFASALNAKLQLLHVITNDEASSDKAIKTLHQLAEKNKLKNYDINIVNNHSLENGLNSFMRKKNPDMIAVLSQGKGKIRKLVYGSSTNDIIKETVKPVFVSKINQPSQ
jgi:nucleotide-binding universal stress UspA family protein